MRALQIENVREFMKKLLMEDAFDNFLLVSFEINKDMNVTIDGKRNLAWYDNAEYMPVYMKWAEVRETVAFLVRGKRSPLQIRAVFRLSEENTAKLISEIEHEKIDSSASGFYFNLKFEENNLVITTGSSISDFRLASVLNSIWDKDMVIFLKHFGIVCTEL